MWDVHLPRHHFLLTKPNKAKKDPNKDASAAGALSYEFSIFDTWEALPANAKT
jgi:hypothetical protein